MHRWLVVLLLGTTSAGCASNYDFDAARDRDGVLDVSRMVVELEEQPEDEHALFDFAIFPLVHTRAEFFVEEQEKELPAGFVSVDLDSWLPLFGFVHAKIERFDESQQPYESHEVSSCLWGLFRRHHEVVDTKHGAREKTRGSFLWIFDWEREPKYTATPKMATPSEPIGAVLQP